MSYYKNQYYGYPDYTTQVMVNQQKQSLKYSYETLGNLLSAAENFADLRGEQYSSYNISSSYDYKGLKGEFAWELDCFRLAMETYQKKYGPYKFPPDCSKEKILHDIQRYVSKMQNSNDKKLYYMMADIINGKKVNTDFKQLYEELDKNANDKFDPQKLKKFIGPLNQVLDQAENEAEMGNMNLLGRGEDTEKYRKQLKNINNQNDCPQKITAFIGEKGKLSFIDEHLVFMNDLNKKKSINGGGLKEIKQNTFLITDKEIIYVTEIFKSHADCILFVLAKKKEINIDAIKKKIEKIVIDDILYYYGEAVLDGRIVDVLFNDEEDMK